MDNVVFNTEVFDDPKYERSAYFDALKFWSNGLGELHRQGSDITEDELPYPLQRAYRDLWFESGTVTSACCYLVQTQKGFGVGLSYEYDECLAEDSSMTMDELFESARKDLENISTRSEFQNVEFFLAKHMGFDESHVLTAVFPADTPKPEFVKGVFLLDELAQKDARSRCCPSLSEDRTEASLKPFLVTVTEIFQRTVVIYAKDNDAAEEQAEELCNVDDICLDGNDFISRSTYADGIASEHDLKSYKAYGDPAEKGPGLDLNTALTKAQSVAGSREAASIDREQDCDRTL